MCSSALAPRCSATCRSRQTDAPDFEREGAGQPLGDHRAALADAGRVECRRAGDFSAAEGGAEGGKGNVQCPPSRARGKAGLVVDGVEGIVGQQLQFEALAWGTGFDEAGLRAGFAWVGGVDRIEAKPPLRSSETVPSKTAWPAGSCRSRLLETPPITRSSVESHSATAPGSPTSNSSHVVSGSLIPQLCGVGAAGCAGKMRLKKGDKDEHW